MFDLCLVTGGAGFIGAHLVERLVQEGRRVRVIDNLSTGRKDNIEPFLSEIEFVEGPRKHKRSQRRWDAQCPCCCSGRWRRACGLCVFFLCLRELPGAP